MLIIIMGIIQIQILIKMIVMTIRRRKKVIIVRRINDKINKHEIRSVRRMERIMENNTQFKLTMCLK